MTNTTEVTKNTTSTGNSLTGRQAVVTGAGTGIGAATSRILAREGARVALVGRRPEVLRQAADGLDAVVLPADVTEPDEVAALAEQARRSLEGIDLVVANAGAMLAAPFTEADRAEWRRMLNVNIMGALDTARAFLPDLLAAADRGAKADLVLSSSIGAHLLLPDYAVYMATKAAVTHLGRGLRQEFGPRGLRVRVIEPGMTRSDLGTDMANAGSRQSLAEFTKQVPPIPAEAIGEAIAWSCAQPVGVNVAALEVLPTHQG